MTATRLPFPLCSSQTQKQTEIFKTILWYVRRGASRKHSSKNIFTSVARIYLAILLLCRAAAPLRAVTALIISLRYSVSKIYPFILYVRIYRIMCARYVDDIKWQWRWCISTCYAILLLQWWSTNTPTFAVICQSITSVKIVLTVFCYKKSLNDIFFSLIFNYYILFK